MNWLKQTISVSVVILPLFLGNNAFGIQTRYSTKTSCKAVIELSHKMATLKAVDKELREHDAVNKALWGSAVVSLSLILDQGAEVLGAVPARPGKERVAGAIVRLAGLGSRALAVVGLSLMGGGALVYYEGKAWFFSELNSNEDVNDLPKFYLENPDRLLEINTHAACNVLELNTEESILLREIIVEGNRVINVRHFGENREEMIAGLKFFGLRDPAAVTDFGMKPRPKNLEVVQRKGSFFSELGKAARDSSSP